MADRFYSEGSKNNGAAGSDANVGSPRPQGTNPYSKIPAKPLGDFSENIDSNNMVQKGYSQPQKKFEVHISNFDDFVGMPEPPTPAKAPPSPISHSTSAKRPVPPTAPSNRGNVAPSGRPMPKRPAAAPTNAPQAKTKKYEPAKQKKAAKAPVKPEKRQKKTTEPKKQMPTEIQAKIRAKKRYNFVKTTLIACVCIFFISIITVTASTIAMQFINDVLAIDKQGGSVSVEIPEGSDFDDVFNILEENNLIKQKNLCYLLLKIRDYDTMTYQPGIYLLDKDAGVEINIETIMTKKSGNKGTVRLTFPEGWTIAQIFEKLEKYEVCTAKKLYANLELVGKQYSFISEIEDNSKRYLKYEGYLFPDTYDFYIDENPTSVLEKFFNNFSSKWTAEFDARAKELGYTVDEIINIAAIIQREANDSSQMGIVSGVTHNRLAPGNPYPHLGMDSTKDYITNLQKNYNLFSEFYEDLYISSYDTYLFTGLPAGPICSPGISAIKAALYPTDTDYYFFMHSPTGQIYLAKNESEHARNKRLYLYN